MHSCVHRNGWIYLKTENDKLNTFQKSFCAPLLQMFLYVFLVLELITVIIIDIELLALIKIAQEKIVFVVQAIERAAAT